jgi:hypothetical protein
MDNILSITGSQVSICFLEDKMPLQEAGLEKAGLSNLVMVFFTWQVFLEWFATHSIMFCRQQKPEPQCHESNAG